MTEFRKRARSRSVRAGEVADAAGVACVAGVGEVAARVARVAGVGTCMATKQNTRGRSREAAACVASQHVPVMILEYESYSS